MTPAQIAAAVDEGEGLRQTAAAGEPVVFDTDGLNLGEYVWIGEDRGGNLVVNDDGFVLVDEPIITHASTDTVPASAAVILYATSSRDGAIYLIETAILQKPDLSQQLIEEQAITKQDVTANIEAAFTLETNQLAVGTYYAFIAIDEAGWLSRYSDPFLAE
ncbi:hypothetical protein FHS18_001761 [Paenibacillus phyllosphaerae]|uniref:Uncharacterized protein n=1 Tax=Paenibacillus phyllosphaerae TaxID=274593 RepID=A0A7W5AVR8_9BACL|nr:hypothetical protein [Paenibacillus phyllosphaerae]MBB3109698.1 hypothetical protein [Paenibacillus phyllosphaerae]